MKQVIRVEKNGHGFFRHDDDFRYTELSRSMVRRHDIFNDPYEDGLDLNQDLKRWLCAYKSIEQFQKWVMLEEIQEAIKFGFEVYLYEVTEYQEGRDQVIFTKEGITKKENITQLFM